MSDLYVPAPSAAKERQAAYSDGIKIVQEMLPKLLREHYPTDDPRPSASTRPWLPCKCGGLIIATSPWTEGLATHIARELESALRR